VDALPGAAELSASRAYRNAETRTERELARSGAAPRTQPSRSVRADDFFRARWSFTADVRLVFPEIERGFR